MKIRALTQALADVSEKAASLARTVRSEETLFQLLVEEKDELVKNHVFLRDFKTLTDVLVQELVRHDLCRKFPELDASVIHGEESNQFTNTLGQSVTISIQETREMTRDLLANVLDGNQSAADLLADVIHSDFEQPISEELTSVDEDIPTNRVSVWIDPIDSTYQYIRGRAGESDGIYTNGLQCVTVLIGVYDAQNGQPIIGVVNQPFHRNRDQRWIGRRVWGIAYNNISLVSSNVTPPTDVTSTSIDDVIVMSTSDTDVVKDRMSRRYRVNFAAGAGYKLLCIVDGLCCAYVQSIGVTYRWDTCAPHALLLARHGGIVPFQTIVNQTKHLLNTNPPTQEQLEEFRQIVEKNQIIYHERSPGSDDEHPWRNIGGLIAYNSLQNLFRIVHTLSE